MNIKILHLSRSTGVCTFPDNENTRQWKYLKNTSVIKCVKGMMFPNLVLMLALQRLILFHKLSNKWLLTNEWLLLLESRLFELHKRHSIVSPIVSWLTNAINYRSLSTYKIWRVSSYQDNRVKQIASGVNAGWSPVAVISGERSRFVLELTAVVDLYWWLVEYPVIRWQ